MRVCVSVLTLNSLSHTLYSLVARLGLDILYGCTTWSINEMHGK